MDADGDARAVIDDLHELSALILHENAVAEAAPVRRSSYHDFVNEMCSPRGVVSPITCSGLADVLDPLQYWIIASYSPPPPPAGTFSGWASYRTFLDHFRDSFPQPVQTPQNSPDPHSSRSAKIHPFRFRSGVKNDLQHWVRADETTKCYRIHA